MSEPSMEPDSTEPTSMAIEKIGSIQTGLKRLRDDDPNSGVSRRERIKALMKGFLPMNDVQSVEERDKMSTSIADVVEKGHSALQRSNLLRKDVSEVHTSDRIVRKSTEVKEIKKNFLDQKRCIRLLNPEMLRDCVELETHFGKFIFDQLGCNMLEISDPVKTIGPSDITACIFQLSLSEVSQLKSSDDTANACEKINLLFTKQVQSLDLFFVTVIVAAKPLNGTKNVSKDMLLVMGTSNAMSKNFMIFLPTTIGLEEKKQALDSLKSHPIIVKYATECFSNQEQDFNCLQTQLSAHNAVYSIGLTKLHEEKSKTGTKIPSKKPWPEIAVVVCLDQVATLSNLDDDEKDLSIFPQRRVTPDKVLKIRGLNMSVPAISGPIYIDATLITKLKKKGAFCISKLKDILLTSVHKNDSDDSFFTIDQHVPRSLQLKSLTYPMNMVSNSSNSCLFYMGVQLSNDATYNPEESLVEQVQKIAQNGKKIDGTVVLVACALGEFLANGGKKINGLKKSPFDLSFENLKTNISNQFFEAQVRFHPDYLDDCFEENNMGADFAKKIDWAVFQDVASEKSLNLFVLVNSALRTAMSSAKTEEIVQLVNWVRLDLRPELDIFHENARDIIKKYAINHFFTVFFVNLFYTVDVLYGLPNNMPRNWLKVRVGGAKAINTRKNSVKDVEAVALSYEKYWDSIFRRSVFSNYDETINPRKISFILAAMNGILESDKTLDEIVDELKSENMESINQKATSYVAGLWKFRLETIPLVTCKGTEQSLDFDPESDSFQVPPDLFSGPVPQDFDMHGTSLIQPASIEDADPSAAAGSV